MQKDVVILSVPYIHPSPTVAPALLASCLEANGISAKGIDFGVLFLKDFVDKPYYNEFKNFITIGYSITPKFESNVFKEVMSYTKQFLQKVHDTHNPKVIGLSIFTGESLDFGLLLSYLLRKHFPNTKLIAGGKGLEVNTTKDQKGYEVWIENNIVDAIVVGDAESTIVDCIKNDWYGVMHSPQQTKEDLDEIPLVNWNDYDLSIYPSLAKHSSLKASEEPYMSVTASKGCVRQCTFCDVADFWPDFIWRDPEKVAQEIIHNYRTTGIQNFQFTDNLINGSITNYRQMNQVLASEIPNSIRYRGYGIFRGKDAMPEEDFELAARAGCAEWAVGVESGSEKLRNDMRKKFSNEDLYHSADMLYKYKISQVWLMMVGYPSETDYDFQQSMDLFKRYQHLAKSGLISIAITPTFMLLNNSPLITNTKLAEQYGLGHNDLIGSGNKFWTSTVYVDNNYPTRSKRFKQLVSLAEDLGYPFNPIVPMDKWKEEVKNLDKIYEQRKKTIVPIPVVKG